MELFLGLEAGLFEGRVCLALRVADDPFRLALAPGHVARASERRTREPTAAPATSATTMNTIVHVNPLQSGVGTKKPGNLPGLCLVMPRAQECAMSRRAVAPTCHRWSVLYAFTARPRSRVMTDRPHTGAGVHLLQQTQRLRTQVESEMLKMIVGSVDGECQFGCQRGTTRRAGPLRATTRRTA